MRSTIRPRPIPLNQNGAFFRDPTATGECIRPMMMRGSPLYYDSGYYPPPNPRQGRFTLAASRSKGSRSGNHKSEETLGLGRRRGLCSVLQLQTSSSDPGYHTCITGPNWGNKTDGAGIASTESTHYTASMTTTQSDL